MRERHLSYGQKKNKREINIKEKMLMNDVYDENVAYYQKKIDSVDIDYRSYSVDDRWNASDYFTRKKETYENLSEWTKRITEAKLKAEEKIRNAMLEYSSETNLVIENLTFDSISLNESEEFPFYLPSIKSKTYL